MKSEDDTRIGRIANTLKDRNKTENYLDRLEAEINRIRYIKDKIINRQGGNTWMVKYICEKDFQINYKLNKPKSNMATNI